MEMMLGNPMMISSSSSSSSSLNPMIIISALFLLLHHLNCRIIFTVYNSDDQLRELIGSVHDSGNDLKVKVFGFNPSAGLLDEIVLWRRVQFIDISKEIFYTTDTTIEFSDTLIFHLFEYVFEEEDDEEVVYIKSGYLYDDKKTLVDVIGPQGQYQIYSRKKGYEKFIKPKLMEFRRLTWKEEEEAAAPELSEHELKKAKDGYSCSIHVRKELAFSRLLQRRWRWRWSINNNIESVESVALMVPSKNSMGSVEDCALVKYLLRSLLDTVNNGNVYIYVGYDRNDPILSDSGNKKWMESFIKSRFEIKFIELPQSGWLTFIWNVLFVEAYNDPIGHTHFIQLNDDVRFESEGWLTSSIEMMKNDTGVRIIGFNDSTWKCKLYTQSLVDRRHYEQFKGHYFPLELRNWYSDNWITSIPNGKCNFDARITNGNVKTRYKSCNNHEYKKIRH